MNASIRHSGDSPKVRRLCLRDHKCRIILYRLPKWQNFILTLAENGRQKICICRKKAVPL